MSSMRSFSGYSKTAPFCPFANQSGMVGITIPCNLVNVDGNVAASGGYFQIHDSAASPSGGAVPLKSFYIASSGNLLSLFQELGPIPIRSGLWFAISSTEATYTAVATNYDVFGEIEEFEGWQPDTQGTSTAGDYTTTVNRLQVWADGSYKKLVRVEYQAAHTAKCLMLFTTDSPSDGSTPLISFPVTADTSYIFDFGRDGLIPFSQTAAYAAHNGCTLAESSTYGTLTATPGNATIKAYYKT